MNQHSPCYILANGTVGFATSIYAAISPFQEQLEWHLRMTSFALGAIATAITIYNLTKPKK